MIWAIGTTAGSIRAIRPRAEAVDQGAAEARARPGQEEVELKEAKIVRKIMKKKVEKLKKVKELKNWKSKASGFVSLLLTL